ncbi:MAG: tRNA (adenosine(37)-N6)-threonylcarbamoyltransferase complex dimerization subunit type 1 TsaB [Acidobacteriota bacterium]
MSNSVTDEQPLILVADTSSARTSLALGQGARLLGQLGIVANERRSTHLLTEIDWLLEHIGLRIDQIDAFAVVVGPGSFTGLRVGIATLKGFAHPLKRPMIALTALEVIARASGPSPCTCVLINAYRGEVFAQLFSIDEQGQVSALSEAVVATLSTVLNEVADFQRRERINGVLFAGDGVEMNVDAIAACATTNGQPFLAAKFLTVARTGWIVQSPLDFLATDTLHYAYEKLIRGETVGAEQLAAYYIRPAEAEIKLKLGLLGNKSGTASETAS